MKVRSTKKALLSAVLSLVVCIAMLVGSTFAWFTDNVVSANNIIKSGNLDVTLEWMDGTEEVADVDDAAWLDASTDAIFSYDLWEPGFTQVRHIKIGNEGSLALKYKVVIETEEADIDLAKVIDVYYFDPAEQVEGREALKDVTPLGTLDKVLGNMDATAAGELAANTDDVITIALKMQETAGNTYMNKSVGGKFTIKLYATQLASEEDSFDNQYDKDALIAWSGKTNTDWYLANPTAAEFEISTAEELAGLAAIVNGTAEGIAQDNFSGQTIKLTSNIDLGNLSWDTIGRKHDTEGTDPFKGTFDGQGHTVYNLNIYIEDDQRDSVGFIGYAENAKIKGLTIENVSINADYFVGAIVGRLGSGEIYDCHVKGDIDIVARTNYVAGIVAYGYYKMEKCSVIADGMGRITSKAVAGGLCGRNNEGANYIKNCTVKNLDIRSGEQVAAITGFAHYGNTISGCNAENVNLTLTDTSVAAPSIGLATGLWYYNESAPITMSDNSFKNITISAINDVNGVVNILHGCEWNGMTTGIVDLNNTMENITNNLNYQ